VSGQIIEAAVVRINDTYFSQETYSTEEWRNMVMCHELGHVWGVPHVDESFSNEPAGTCMDYSLDPVPNQSPNNDDFIKLESLYTEANASTGTSPDTGTDTGTDTEVDPVTKPCKGKKCRSAFEAPLDMNAPNYWGKLKSKKGTHEVYEMDMGNGRKSITFVTRKAAR